MRRSLVAVLAGAAAGAAGERFTILTANAVPDDSGPGGAMFTGRDDYQDCRHTCILRNGGATHPNMTCLQFSFNPDSSHCYVSGSDVYQPSPKGADHIISGCLHDEVKGCPVPAPKTPAPPVTPAPTYPPPAPPTPGGNAFACGRVAPAVPWPADASQLHPSHVSVVMAIGDSITAAFTANSGAYEIRNASWSIGAGSAEQLTMPYILQRTSAENASFPLEGASTDTHAPEIHGEPHVYPNKDHLNAAQSEAVAADLMKQQVPYLINQARRVQGLADRWKVLTIWIGANDLCGSCKSDGDTANKAASYAANLDEVLAAVTGNFTNIYINLVSTLQLSSLVAIQQTHLFCKTVQSTVDECGCVSKDPSFEKSAALDKANALFNAELPKLAKKYDRIRPDVAVTVKDFMGGQTIPDVSWLSRLDCFHPAAKAHQSLGVALWNAMLGDTAKWDPNAAVRCPTPDTVLA